MADCAGAVPLDDPQPGSGIDQLPSEILVVILGMLPLR